MTFDIDIGARVSDAGPRMHGTTLSTGDFHFFAEPGVAGWSVCARTHDGQDSVFVVWGPLEPSSQGPDTTAMYCATRRVEVTGPLVSDELVALPHPFARVIGRPAPLQDWFDAILMQDAAGAASRRHEHRWGGSGLDDVMVRVEHGISSYASHEVAPSSFEALPDLQA